MATGIAGQIAPEFRFDNWLANTDGDLKIADIEEPIIYLYNFQSWCLSWPSWFPNHEGHSGGAR